MTDQSMAAPGRVFGVPDLMRIFADWEVVQFSGTSAIEGEQELHLTVRKRVPAVAAERAVLVGLLREAWSAYWDDDLPMTEMSDVMDRISDILGPDPGCWR